MRKYWVGGCRYEDRKLDMFDEFIGKKIWEMGHDKDSEKGKKRYELMREIAVDDKFALKATYGEHQVKIRAIGTVISIKRRDEGSIDIKWNEFDNLYDGVAPKGEGAGNWRISLVQVKRPEDIKLIFGINDDNILKTNTIEKSLVPKVIKILSQKIPVGPIEKPILVKVETEEWKRTEDFKLLALENANYTCELDNDHVTFQNKKNDKNYVEGHHLIPMKLQKDFEYSIDVPENIVCLCPNCHRLLHNAKPKDRDSYLKLLYDERMIVLKEKRGVSISFKALCSAYCSAYND